MMCYGGTRSMASEASQSSYGGGLFSLGYIGSASLRVVPEVLVAPEVSGTDEGMPSVVTMEDAVEFALSHNHDIDRLRIDVQTAEDKVKEAELLNKPTLQANARVQSNGPSEAIAIPLPGNPINIQVVDTDPVWTGSLTLTQPVYTFGSIPLAIRGAKLGLDQANFLLARAEEKLTNDVETAFLQATLTKALVEVAGQSVSTAEERLRIAKAKFDAGTVPKFEVLRSEVSLAVTQDSLVKAQTSMALSMSALVQKLGLDAGTVINVVAPDTEAVVATPLSMELSDAQNTALANRNDLKALGVSVELAKVGIDVAKNRPMLGFQGNYSRSDHATGFAQKENWSLGLNLSYTLYDSGRAHAATKEAVSKRDSLLAKVDETRSLVSLEVENAYRSLNDAIDRIAVASATVESASEALRIAKVGYSEGVIPYIDYQDADLGYNQAETMYLQAVYGYLIAESNLKAAL
jgi:outer membrane protein